MSASSNDRSGPVWPDERPPGIERPGHYLCEGTKEFESPTIRPQNILCGWYSDVTGEKRMVRPSQGEVTPVPFMGMYAMSPATLERDAGDGHILDY